jgi:hypothetical protein
MTHPDLAASLAQLLIAGAAVWAADRLARAIADRVSKWAAANTKEPS